MNRSPGADCALADQLLRHAAWTRRLARSLLGDEAQAEDAVQDTWLAALRLPPRLDRPLAPWLRSVLHRRVLNRLRGDRRRRARESATPAPPPAPSPEEQLLRRQTEKLLVDLVAVLAEPYRKIVVLRYFDGLSSTEIAAQMHLPPPTVRGRLRTGLAELREALERRCGGRRAWTLALEPLAGQQEGDGPAMGEREGEGSRPPAAPPGAASRGVLVLAILASTVTTVGLALRPPSPPAAEASPAAILRPERSSAGPRPPPPLEPAPAAAPAGAAVEEPAAPPPGPVPAVLPAAATAPALAGTVRFLGRVPPPTPVDRAVEPICARSPVPDPGDLAVSRTGGLANVVVRVVAGWTGSAAPPDEPLTFEQRGCRFHPRVAVARVGQRIALHNEDETVHQVHARTGDRTLLARPQPFRAPALELRAERAGEVVHLACDSHPITAAHVLVSETPFFDVTDEHGHFRLTALPPGPYRLEAWHERLGTRQLEVRVPSPEITFDFAAPPPAPAPATPGACAIALEGDNPVTRACAKDGRKGAKRVMKAMVAKARMRGLHLSCDDCHRNDDDWSLHLEARPRFEDLLQLASRP